MQHSLEPTAPLTSDGSVDKVGEQYAKIGLVHNVVVVEVTNARGTGALAPCGEHVAQVCAVGNAVSVHVMNGKSLGGKRKMRQCDGDSASALICFIPEDLAYRGTHLDSIGKRI